MRAHYLWPCGLLLLFLAGCGSSPDRVILANGWVGLPVQHLVAWLGWEYVESGSADVTVKRDGKVVWEGKNLEKVTSSSFAENGGIHQKVVYAPAVQLKRAFGVSVAWDPALRRATVTNPATGATLILETGDSLCTVTSSIFPAVQANDLQQVERILASDKSAAEFYALSVSPARTLLAWAAAVASADMVRLLLKSGADPNAKSPGDTPLAEAVKRGDVEIVGLLLDHGAALTAQLGHIPALHIACQWGDIAVVETLLNKKAEINRVSASVGTPLMVAIKRGDLALAQFLLKKGADPNVTWQGTTSLALAKERNDANMATLLRGYAAR